MSKRRTGKSKVKTSVHFREERVGPTAERLAHANEAVEKGETGTIVMRDAPLERMRKNGKITEDQYQAGYRFRDVWNAAGLKAHYGSQDLNRVRGTDGATYGMPASEGMAIKRDLYRLSMKALGIRVGLVVTDIVCHEVTAPETGKIRLGWNATNQANAAAVEVLRAGLDILAVQFGIKKGTA